MQVARQERYSNAVSRENWQLAGCEPGGRSWDVIGGFPRFLIGRPRPCRPITTLEAVHATASLSQI